MTKRKVEIFSAGCPICENTIELVNSLACPSCEIVIHDMHDESVQQQAKKLGVNSIPAVGLMANWPPAARDAVSAQKPSRLAGLARHSDS